MLMKDGGQGQNSFWLKDLPVVVLNRIAFFLHGDDALSFCECFPIDVVLSERQFWKTLRL
jgi:hypothetical protein